ncbi:MAG: TonB-dependent receptor [Myxococcaceae bacterium]
MHRSHWGWTLAFVVSLSGSAIAQEEPPPTEGTEAPPVEQPPAPEQPQAPAAPSVPEAARPALSQVTGVVVDATNKKPVADVVVTLSSPTEGENVEVTSTDGRYSFARLTPGVYSLRFEAGNYKPLAKQLVLEGGKDLTANIELLPEELVIEETVVTGSRLPGLEVGKAAPVTVVSREDITTAGRTSIGDILQRLPEQMGGINTQFNNGGEGSTRMDLRAFGTQRTLVLLNGRRMVAGGTGADSSVDLNTIPSSAIERVEILKDGASAIYGSDAVTGVVNIITRKDYEGTEVNGFTGLSQRGDGLVYDLNFTTGRATERGSVMFSANFYRQNDVWSDKRDFSRFDYGVAGFDWLTNRKYTGGSSATPDGFFSVPLDPTTEMPVPGNASWEALKAANPDASFYTVENGQFRPFRLSGVTEAGGDFYNYQPDNYLVTPSQRFSLFSTGSLRMGSTSQGYFEALYTHRESAQLLAPEPLFVVNEGLIVSAQNHHNPFGVDFDDVRRRLVEFGNRAFNQEIDTFRLVAGVRGEFTPKWNWDVNVNYGRTQGVETKAGMLQRSKLAAALGPSFVDADGIARCGTPGAVVADCVPLNLFGGVGSITPEMRDYLTYRGTARGFNQQVIATASTAVELFKILNAASPVGLAAGYEHRREAGANVPDPLTAQGDTTGNKIAITEGSYYVNEGYLELNVPILGRFGQQAPGNLWELSAAARAVNYSTFGSNLSYKFGTRISPVPDVTLRGTFSTAFRAPSVGELYLGALDSFESAKDPCSEREQGTPTDAQCDREGVPDGYSDPSSQQRTRWGGNPNLKPETSTAFTIGTAIQPRWVKDLVLTVDYYNLSVKDAIQSLGTTVILSNCYNNGVDCDRIHRTATGKISSIDDPLTNVGGDRLAGIDFLVDYSPMTPIGRVGANLNLNWLAFRNQTLASGDVIRGKNVYDLELVLPEWKANVGLTWARDALSAGVNLRTLGGIQECEDNACENVENPRRRNVEAYAMADVFVGYQIKHPGTGVTNIGAGVNNVTDVAPPYIVNGFLAASDAAAYDYMGRYFYVRLTHEFN